MNRSKLRGDQGSSSHRRLETRTKEKPMKLMIAAMMAVFAVAALPVAQASAKGIPITAHRCKIPHYTHGIVWYTNGICR
jgi:hypothetical protein